MNPGRTIALDPDFGRGHPLWTDLTEYDIDGENLPAFGLSESLNQRISQWNDYWNTHYTSDYTWEDGNHEKWFAEGHSIADAIEAELPDVQVQRQFTTYRDRDA